MAAIVAELLDAPRIVTGQSPAVELHYRILGTDDHVEARAAMLAESPETFDPWGSGLFYLPRTDSRIEPDGIDQWDGYVYYSAREPIDVGSIELDTDGGVEHVTQSLSTVNRYAAAGKEATDHGGAIGVTPDGSIEGVDVGVPGFPFSVPMLVSRARLTSDFLRALFDLSWHVNDAPFSAKVFDAVLTFDTGECLFKNATLSAPVGADFARVRFNFLGRPNETDLSVGDGAITGIEKRGHEYLWVEYEDVEDETAGRIAKRPVAAHVEQVFPYGDFSRLGGGFA